MGFLIACYIAIAPGKYDWVQGHETKEYRAKNHHERSLFVPTDTRLQAVVVNTNDCKYLEDPVLKQIQILEARKIDKIKVGNRAWCLVDEYGRQVCTYDTMQQCLKRMRTGEYCEPNQ